MPRSYVCGAKDRLDHTIDRVRTVRSDRFRYTRNYKTDRVFLQPQYRDRQPYTKNLRELYASGQLSPKLTEIYFGERPAEEFYDVKVDPSQLHNLIDDPKFAEDIALHRQWLDQWLAKGDSGIGEESHEELAYQADGKKWGTGVNPEYEAVRQDNDGDGLSDSWETVNGRDPNDGRLLFTFDCGGWQTEGWKATTKEIDNIAGRQGFLDFHLDDNGAAVLRRDGLNLDAASNAGDLTVKFTKGASVHYSFFAVDDSGTLSSIENSSGLPKTTTALELRLRGNPGQLIEIDWIKVK